MAKKPKAVEGVYEKNPGSGIWYTRLRVNGKLVRKKIGTHQEAKKYIESARTIRDTGNGIVPTTARVPARTLDELRIVGGTVTVGELCDQYLKHIQNPNNPDRPRDQVNPPIRIKAIKKAFGDRPAGSLKPHEVKDWLVDVISGAPATMNRYKSAFSAIYRYAKERAMVEANPVRDTEQFKVKLPQPRYLKPDEEKRLYDVLNRWIEECPEQHQFTKLILRSHPLEIDIAIGTGLRKGNQYELRWDWIDFPSRLIHIPKSKTGDAITVPIIDRTYNALKQLESIQNEAEEIRKAATFTQSPTRMVADGRVFLIRENRSWWEKALKEAEIKSFRWHDLRHTTASRMVQSAVPLKVIMEVLAHKSVATTNRYAHLNKDTLRNAMSVLN